MKPCTSARSRQYGLTLIELMIAITIGLILVLGLIQVFSASRAAYQLSQGIARNQENARFALDFMQRDIRMAGHAGCVNDQSLLSTDAAGKITGGNIRSLFLNDAAREANDASGLAFPLRFDVSVQGFEASGTAPGDVLSISTTPSVGVAGNWTPALPDALAGLSPIHGSDIIVLRYMSPIQSTVTAMNVTTSGNSTLGYASEAASTSSKVATGGSGLYAIGNCGATSVFQATGTPSNTTMAVNISGLNQTALGYTVPGTNTHVTENYSYAPNQTWLYRAETMAYYVALNTTNNVPALYRVRWTAPDGGELAPVPEEMVEGVESIQLRYGEDSAALTAAFPSGYIDKSASAATIGDPMPHTAAGATSAKQWQRVGNVQMGLLVRGTNDRAAVDQSDQAKTVLGVQITAPADGHFRYSYETTIALRNRLFGN
jgi:type IV pilus assembly protein PilW